VRELLPPQYRFSEYRRRRSWRIKPLFRWFDFWIGLYWDRHGRRLYVLPLPMCGVVLQFAPLPWRPDTGQWLVRSHYPTGILCWLLGHRDDVTGIGMSQGVRCVTLKCLRCRREGTFYGEVAESLLRKGAS